MSDFQLPHLRMPGLGQGSGPGVQRFVEVGQRIEDRGQRTEVRGQRTEVGDQEGMQILIKVIWFFSDF